MSIDPINNKPITQIPSAVVSAAMSKKDTENRSIEKTDNSSENNLEGNENDSFPGEKKLIELIEKSNKELKNQDVSLKFSIHEKTKAINIKVIRTTVDGKKEVIREFPPEKILDMVASMMERAGLFVDKRG